MVATADGAAPFQLLDLTKVGYGAATLYLAPVGTAFPADTVNMGVNWGTGIPAWVPIGSTDDGVHYGANPTLNPLTVEESPIAAAQLVDSLDFPVTATFAEDVLANVRIAIGLGTIATQAPGIGAVGKSTLTLGTLPIQFALGIEHANPYGHWTRVSVPNVMSASQITVDNRRSAGKRMYAATFFANCLPSQILIIQKTAESTG